MDLGLARVQALLRRVGSPHTRFPVIHVAGTNGKGSTTAYLDSLLTYGVGLRSGRFNSPHLIIPRDCARVQGGIPIDAKIWALAEQQTHRADRFCEVSQQTSPIDATPFELLTVQTLLAFTLLPDESRPEVLIMEVGVGGRLDATNVFPDENVLASVICPIDIDHEAVLGHGLAAIAREKAGIIKRNGLCIIADQRKTELVAGKFRVPQPVEVGILESLQAVCEAQQARAVPTTIPFEAIHYGVANGQAEVARLRCPATFSLPMHSPSSFSNLRHANVEGSVNVETEATLARLTGSTTALQTLWSIAHDKSEANSSSPSGLQKIRDTIRTQLFGEKEQRCAEAIQNALLRYVWEGRCEWKTLGGHTPVLVDGAHNASSALALRQYLEQCLDTYASTSSDATIDVRLTWIMAFSEGKDFTTMLSTLLEAWPDSGRWQCKSQRVAFVPFSTPVEGMPWVQPMNASKLESDCTQFDHTNAVQQVTSFAKLREALAWAAANRQQGLEVVVVCGSLYLVSDYYRTCCDA
ncbi:dihydrofolate synthase [Malassezia yamatoensis]|uniref:Dihydrofolate synthase n=1 Tax=Malassezia yamatoensis TaxID=253288 RepID=A0AAJ5YR02_9BASI|nr:dihydrofolate synthase [Malassezia yamatoensis]